MNAINADFLREKNEVFRAAANDPRIRVVITKEMKEPSVRRRSGQLWITGSRS
jgi:hypothetical protein